ncbi:MAG: 50S ribosomal protein P1 [Nitrososphaerota archaeon]
MEYIYAALLLHSLGKEVDEPSLKKVVEAAGGQPDEIRIKALVAALKKVNIAEVIKGATGLVAAAPAAPPPAPQPAAAPAEKKEEAEEKKEEAMEGLAALFG